MLLAEPARDFGKFRDGPAHAWQARAGLQHGVRRIRGDSLLRQLASDCCYRIGLRENLGARNWAARQAREIELRDAMLDGVHGWRAIKFLRVRHRNVVEKRILISGPAYAQRRARRAGEHGAARAAVLIEYDRKLAAQQIERRLTEATRKNNLSDWRITFEHRREARLDQYRDSQVGAPGMQCGDRGSLQNQIAQRAQADNQNFGALRQGREQS